MEVTIGIIILVITLVIGVPIPFAFGATVIWLAFSLGFQTDFLLSAGYTQLNSVVLLAIPLFILAGGIMERGRIGKLSLAGWKIRWPCQRRSWGCGCCRQRGFRLHLGSASATLSCIGSIMEPRMTKSGYDKGYTAALMVAACPLGLLIPQLGPNPLCLVQQHLSFSMLYCHHYSRHHPRHSAVPR